MVISRKQNPADIHRLMIPPLERLKKTESATSRDENPSMICSLVRI